MEGPGYPTEGGGAKIDSRELPGEQLGLTVKRGWVGGPSAQPIEYRGGVASRHSGRGASCGRLEHSHEPAALRVAIASRYSAEERNNGQAGKAENHRGPEGHVWWRGSRAGMSCDGQNQHRRPQDRPGCQKQCCGGRALKGACELSRLQVQCGTKPDRAKALERVAAAQVELLRPDLADDMRGDKPLGPMWWGGDLPQSLQDNGQRGGQWYADRGGRTRSAH